MKYLLLSLSWVAFGISETTAAEIPPETSAPAVALTAFRNATEVLVDGTAAADFTSPLLPVHVKIKQRKTIREIQKFLESGRFHAIDEICPEKWATGSLAILYFTVTKDSGENIKIYLIQGDSLRIAKLHDGVSEDPNFIFPLGRLLLRSQKNAASHQR